MSTRPSSPIAARVEVIRPAAADSRGKVRAVTAVTVGEDEAVFPGHYPGFPIFPGVCVIECVHLSGLRTPPPGTAGLELVAVESTRFLRPVFPGDRLEVDLVWTGGSGAWRCAAKVATERGAAAQVRLRFTGEEEPTERGAAAQVRLRFTGEEEPTERGAAAQVRLRFTGEEEPTERGAAAQVRLRFTGEEA
ncbi:3-hydroxyacyl-ACP dehydratase FabZ family protein [Streptomyces rapamycinicus]|uniref:ApeI dehydratase-like domain-containing protein n=2 Tax=Streptomyces rapamycinicus TaxID=1226757 RepID=A0A3L8RJQ2_STRRN|nr:3-hydroxyacyl-ACP dehydratase [Streptomyces rapamycinicus]MBB4784621.1 3-hydroxymyristoyl/3-hydroxydecanoyl-(acyl carrier protein) dehydratase [Streptomyces rapamycinicus]RLV79897.1 hypothetical protein D3C57_115970 [Streptomyces rapamycinicus NRRL 5491]UTO64908.1 3-hydroxyacyl-ACP dehydratase [Streptomyces rapamycinicus]UTP32863.1 3-hydroxyacyl-ACP dehydratase [Streptomyces rapamycinicus NRRL 5491]